MNTVNLKYIHRKMPLTDIFFYFTRNNPRNINKFSQLFISLIGYENREKLIPEIRNQWENSSNSFDKMYGLIRAWNTAYTDIPDSWFIKSEPEPSDHCKQITELREEQDLNEQKVKTKTAEFKLKQLEFEMKEFE